MDYAKRRGKEIWKSGDEGKRRSELAAWRGEHVTCISRDFPRDLSRDFLKSLSIPAQKVEDNIERIEKDPGRTPIFSFSSIPFSLFESRR